MSPTTSTTLTVAQQVSDLQGQINFIHLSLVFCFLFLAVLVFTSAYKR